VREASATERWAVIVHHELLSALPTATAVEPPPSPPAVDASATLPWRVVALSQGKMGQVLLRCEEGGHPQDVAGGCLCGSRSWIRECRSLEARGLTRGGALTTAMGASSVRAHRMTGAPSTAPPRAPFVAKTPIVQ
jgi:hypothetical protein